MDTSDPKNAAPVTWRTLFIDTSLIVAPLPTVNLLFMETSPMTVRRWFKDKSPCIKRRLLIETSDPKNAAPVT